MSFDISSLAAKDSFELHLKHPVTEELLYADKDKTKPVKIVLHGPSSPQYVEAVTAMQNRSLKRTREKKQVSAESLKTEGIDLLVACSDHALNLTYNGAELDNADAFREMYSDAKYKWLKDAVDEAVGDIGNFLD